MRRARRRAATGAAALLLALAACDQARPGADGYAFERKEWFRPGAPIEFHIHPSIEDLRAAAPAAPLDARGGKLMAWSRIDRAGCEVHIVDPAVSYAPEFIGHEVTHCLYGRWHD